MTVRSKHLSAKKETTKQEVPDNPKNFIITIGGTIWAVKLVPSLQSEAEPGECVLGLCDTTRQEILVVDNLSRYMQLFTILHEIVHMAMRNIRSESQKMREEDVCDSVAEAMLIVMPQLPKWFVTGMAENYLEMVLAYSQYLEPVEPKRRTTKKKKEEVSNEIT